MEVALLLGLTGDGSPEPLGRRLPALDPDAIVLLGQRDDGFRAAIGAPSIAGRVSLHPAESMHAHPHEIALRATEQLSRHSPAWWLHIDLDVLRGDQFPACASANDPAMPGGLSWAELAVIVKMALQAPRCRGMSFGVYNTDLDPDGDAARSIVGFLAEIGPSSAAAATRRADGRAAAAGGRPAGRVTPVSARSSSG
ncbi:hypothetical protein [Pseudonocardia sp. GCM10023141]|uniref:hypothetical protein n=1 Tax=Pseudonocardia sp. GCM10023141 TaxID=3252653 RepID=UPI0036232972